MDFWDILRTLHLLAMAFFVGGQLMLVSTIVPALKGTDQIGAVARRFGMGSGIALIVLIITGVMMAGEFNSWEDPVLHAKIGLLVVVLVLTAVHMRDGTKAWMHSAIGVLSLAIVFLGTALAHG